VLEIDPMDGQGQLKKKRGYVVMGKIQDALRIRIIRLAEALTTVNPKAVKSNSRVIEV
jgi:hypothetical protein